MLLSTGERISLRAVRDGDQRPRPQGDLADRLAGRASSPTRRTPRRASSTSAPTASARRSTRTRSCWSPASRASRTAKDVTTLGRGGSDTTAVALAAAVPRRRLRDLHRRGRRLHAPTRASCPTRASSPSCQLRRDARDGGLRRRRPAAALGRVRPQPRRAHPLPLQLRRRTRVPLSSPRRTRRWSTP